MYQVECLLFLSFLDDHHRDHLKYCDLTADRQRGAHALLWREQHDLAASHLERRSPALSYAIKQLSIYTVVLVRFAGSTRAIIFCLVRVGSNEENKIEVKNEQEQNYIFIG